MKLYRIKEAETVDKLKLVRMNVTMQKNMVFIELSKNERMYIIEN